MPPKRKISKSHDEIREELAPVKARISQPERQLEAKAVPSEQLQATVPSDVSSDPAPRAEEDTIDDMLARLELERPGTIHHYNRVKRRYEAAMENGTWHWDNCYTPHRDCFGQIKIAYGQMYNHQGSKPCGGCIRALTTVRCERKHRNDGDCCFCVGERVCLTRNDFKDIYEKLEKECPSFKEKDKFKLLRLFLEDHTEIKLAYLKNVYNDFIDTKTVEHPHPRHEKPCRLHPNSARAKKDPPRTSLSLHFPMWRLRFLIHAYETNDEELKESLYRGDGKMSHRCRPVDDSYCWEWTHIVWESIQKNSVRDNACFTGTQLCRCDTYCLDNGFGKRFVRNVEPVDPNFGGWRPATGKLATFYGKSEERVERENKVAKVEDDDVIKIIDDSSDETWRTAKPKARTKATDKTAPKTRISVQDRVRSARQVLEDSEEDTKPMGTAVTSGRKLVRGSRRVVEDSEEGDS